MSQTLKEAARLYKMGFGILWLHPKSKRPIEMSWASGRRKTWKELVTTYREGYNIGTRLGMASKIKDGFLAAIDLDVKGKDERYKKEAIAAVNKLLKTNGEKVICPAVLSGRGGGSRHYYYLSAQPFKAVTLLQSPEIIKVHMPSKKPNKKELETLTPTEISQGIRFSHAWEIALYSEGRQVVLPPSVHPDSNREYKWGRELTSSLELPILAIGPELSAEDTLKPKEKLRNESNSSPGFEFSIEKVDIGWIDIPEDVRNGITTGEGVSDRSAYLLTAASSLKSAGLSVNEILNVLTDKDNYISSCSYEHAKTKHQAKAAAWVYKYTIKKLLDERNVQTMFGVLEEVKYLTPEQAEEQAEELMIDGQWEDDLDQTQNGNYKPTFKNVLMILENEVDEQLFVKDVFINRVVYSVDAPWGRKKGQYLEDIDLINIKSWFADSRFRLEPAQNLILEVISQMASCNEIHPVKEWLETLKWDGVSRIDTWLKDYCQAKAAQPYLSEVSRKFMLAMVKRIYEPGCQWDYVLILEGKQGGYKSSMARAIASEKWFLDSLPDLKDKDAMTYLQGKWLVELGELAGVKRTDFNQVKTYLNRRIDTVRPHYGRIHSDVPRQSVFIGTVNEGQYLKDPTGNRRFWPVKVGVCKIKAFNEVREQIFAEAVHIYKSTNEMLMLGEKATLQATAAQDARREDDDISMMKEAFIEFKQSKVGAEFNFDKFKTEDLCLGVDAPWGRWLSGRYFYNNAATVLRDLGFYKGKSEGIRYWRPAENEKINAQYVSNNARRGGDTLKTPPEEMN